MSVFKILTEEQAQSIEGQHYMPGATFWWVFDGNNPSNKVLSALQTQQCCNDEFMWVKDLPEIEWVEPQQPPINNEP